jgi:hypothetical protein
MTYQVNLRVSHRTPSGEVWEASGHGLTVKGKNPETLWALEAMEAGLDPNQGVRFEVQSNGLGFQSRSLLVCGADAAKARQHFKSIPTTQEAV